MKYFKISSSEGFHFEISKNTPQNFWLLTAELTAIYTDLYFWRNYAQRSNTIESVKFDWPTESLVSLQIYWRNVTYASLSSKNLCGAVTMKVPVSAYASRQTNSIVMTGLFWNGLSRIRQAPIGFLATSLWLKWVLVRYHSVSMTDVYHKNNAFVYIM